MADHIPGLYFDKSTNAVVQVRELFEAVFAPEIFANIKDVRCEYDKMNDEISFTVTRKRDGEKAKFGIARHWFASSSLPVEAMRYGEDMLVKVILFLA